MRIYLIIASCLVDEGVCRWLVKAKSEREAWCKGYDIVSKSPVADSGSMDCVRVTKPETVIKYIESGAKLV